MQIKISTRLKIRILLLLQTVIVIHTSSATNLNVPAVRNSIKTTIPRVAVTNATQLNASNSLTTIQFTDGLGQPNSTVQKGITTSKKDLVTIANYNCLGELSNQWLPTPMDNITKPDPATVMQQAKTFYADLKPYTTIDPIPAGNILIEGTSVCKPGEAWHNAGKVQKQELMSSNFTNPELFIRQYSVVGNNIVLTDDPDKYYQVSVLKTTDEDGKVNYIFTDAWDKILLKRMVNNGEFHDTYFIYDDMGYLRFVLSPEASDKMTTAGTYTVNDSADPIFAYKYDGKGRCIAKKIPGKGWNYMIYDIAGHLAFSQDGNQGGNNEWTYYKYDALDRLIQSGKAYGNMTTISQIYTGDAVAVESYVAGTGYTNNHSLGANSVLLTQNFYDTYDYLNIPAYSTIKSYYTYTTVAGSDPKYSNIVNGVDIATQGMLTGTTVAMLSGVSDSRYSVMYTVVTAKYYDDKGRVVQSISNNSMKTGGATYNGYDKDYYAYNFAGQVTKNQHFHKAFANTELKETYRFLYDQGDRLTSLRHSFNTYNEVIMDSLLYNELGEVSKKTFHRTSNSMGGEYSVNYAYNIQNKLKSISSPQFNEMLYYDNGGTGSPLYNGNISSTTNGTGAGYAYSYDGLNRLTSAIYSDPVNSANNNAFNENISSYDKDGNIRRITRSGWARDFTTLDANGSPVINKQNIDDLTITYAPYYCNQIKEVVDANNDNIYMPVGLTDFKDKGGVYGPYEYYYDGNGNMTADYNKGIAWIKYNMLNLPEKIQYTNGNKTEYVYDAAGVKRQVMYSYANTPMQIPLGDYSTENTTNIKSISNIRYCGRYIYENYTLKKVLTPDGYIQTSGTTPLSNIFAWTHYYNLKDHLGNTRVQLNAGTYSSNTYSVTGTTDYYPSGMEITPQTGSTTGTNPYLYGGKELDRINGLNEYDFNARWYDHALGGFTTIDPLAEKTPWISPYAYCANNPVNYIDPTGMSIVVDGVLCSTNSQAEVTGYYLRNEAYLAFWRYNDKSYNNTTPLLSEQLGWTGSYSSEVVQRPDDGGKLRELANNGAGTKTYGNQIKNTVIGLHTWVKKNKYELLAHAKSWQKTGDNTAKIGLGMAAVGVWVDGVGAAPGMLVFAGGKFLSESGTYLEEGVNILTGDFDEAVNLATGLAVDNIAGKGADICFPGKFVWSEMAKTAIGDGISTARSSSTFSMETIDNYIFEINQ